MERDWVRYNASIRNNIFFSWTFYPQAYFIHSLLKSYVLDENLVWQLWYPIKGFESTIISSLMYICLEKLLPIHFSSSTSRIVDVTHEKTNELEKQPVILWNWYLQTEMTVPLHSEFDSEWKLNATLLVKGNM